MAYIDSTGVNSGERKPRWRTPALTAERVVEGTNIDTNSPGLDGAFTTYNTPLNQTS